MDKVCFKCGQSKPLTEFYAHKYMKDGHLNKCKTCARTDVQKHRHENIEKLREYDRKRASLPHRVELRARVVSAWAEMHPDRRAAQIAVRKAVRNGTLKKSPCFVCGEKSEAHHPDYSRPLDVVWLCPPHHKQAHALIKGITCD